MWHSARARDIHPQVWCQQLQENSRPCEEYNTHVGLMVCIRRHIPSVMYRTYVCNRKCVILRQRVRGFVIAIRAIRTPGYFQRKLVLLLMKIRVILLANNSRDFTWCPYCSLCHFIGGCFRHSLPIIRGAEMKCSAIPCQCSDHSTDLFAFPGAAVQWMERFREVLEARISWHQCESIVKLILVISSFEVFEQPVQSVFNWTQ